MRKRNTKKTVETIKKTAAKTAEKVAEIVPELVETVSEKAEEFMNSPVMEEGREAMKETAEKVSVNVRTRISDISLEIFELSISVKDIEKAVKKDAADKKLKGEIKIYINAEERAAYYTVNDEENKGGRIDLKNI